MHDLRQPLATLASTKNSEMETINIYPVVISWKPNKKGEVPVAIRFDFNRQRIGHEQLSHRILLSDWDENKRLAKNSYPNSSLLNQLIENKLNKHRNFFLRRETFQLPITRDLIKQYIKAGTSMECFTDYAEIVIENKKLKDGKPYSADTKRRYRDEIKRLMQFKPNLGFNQLDAKFLQSYKLWMQNEYLKKDKTRLDQNSIWKALSFIRMVYNYAVDQQIILSDSNPFKIFQVGSFETNTTKIKFLELDEVSKIEKVLIEQQSSMNEITYRVGWRFLAMCVSGMRISDAMNLDDAFFNDSGDLCFTPHKTIRHGNLAQVPMTTERQRRYMAKTLSLPLPQTEAKNFRTTFNIHLKILAALAGISINLTSHVGRHTMGSFLVDGNVETPAAMAMLGIKSEKVLATYKHLKQSKLRSESDKLKGVM